NKKLLKEQAVLAEQSGRSLEIEITRSVRNAWYSYQLNRETLRILSVQDSLYARFVKKAEVRWKTGETSKLELISAQTKFQEVQTIRINSQAELNNSEALLRQLINIKGPILVAESDLMIQGEPTGLNGDLSSNPQARIEMQNIEVANARLAVEKSRLLPDFSVGYSQQMLVSGFNPAGISRTYSPGTRIAGFQIGLAVPIFNGAGRSRVSAEKLAIQVARSNYESIQSQVSLAYIQETQRYESFKKQVDFYRSTGLKLAEEQTRIAQVSFDLGEIGYLEYTQHISGAVQTKLAYLEALSRLNQSAIQIQYLKGN
ncbi:MAG: TolC family protein, partial [Flavobacterium sp.]